MPHRLYVLAFVTTAFIFVPVSFHAYPQVPVSMTGPCCYPAFLTICNGGWFGFGLILKAITCLYLALYTFIFYASAKVTGWLADEEPRMRLVIQTVMLLIIFSCSFLRVIHASYFVNDTGTYDFWEACLRFYQLK